MKSHYYPDGSFISYLGDLSQPRILLLINRDNPTKNTQILPDIATSIALQDHAIVWYDFPYRKSFFFRFHWEVLLLSPSIIQIGLWYLKQLGSLILNVHRWMTVSSAHLEQLRSVQGRCNSLKQFLGQFSADQKLVFLTQSAGGKIASLVSQDVVIERMVCLGYPFKHPDKAPESVRYLHLETITTPFLVLQGKDDPYGTQNDVLARYKLSPSVRVEGVQTDHDFRLSEEEKKRVLSYIRAFLGVQLGSRHEKK